jgi:hypothetical protein
MNDSVATIGSTHHARRIPLSTSKVGNPWKEINFCISCRIIFASIFYPKRRPDAALKKKSISSSSSSNGDWWWLSDARAFDLDL